MSALQYLIFGVGWYVGLPAHCVISGVCDLLILRQRIIRPGDFDGIVADDGGLHAHWGKHGGRLGRWGVRGMMIHFK